MVRSITAYQGIVSKPVEHFDFMKLYRLEKYVNRYIPVVLFGIYNLNILKIHKGYIILCWCGNDSRKQVNNYSLLKRPNVINVTPLPAVRKFMGKRGVECHLIKPVMHNRINPLKKGDKVYAYLNHFKPEYHGSEIVKKLNIKHKMLIGDFSVPTGQWIAGKMYDYYSQCFIGLFLSSFAGGGMGVIEMGLCGIPCVTNVMDLPHCRPWKTIEDIEQIINQEAENIGTVNEKLAWEVEKRIVKREILKGFELNKLLC